MPAARIPRTVARGKPKPNLHRRVQHLAFVRQLPCVACGKAAPSDAAHVRTGTDGGVGMKPGDRYAVPLCVACHAKPTARTKTPQSPSIRRIDSPVQMPYCLNKMLGCKTGEFQVEFDSPLQTISAIALPPSKIGTGRPAWSGNEKEGSMPSTW